MSYAGQDLTIAQFQRYNRQLYEYDKTRASSTNNMTQAEQQKAAKKFIESRKGKGYEKGESQKFWLDLLCNVFGITDFTNNRKRVCRRTIQAVRKAYRQAIDLFDNCVFE